LDGTKAKSGQRIFSSNIASFRGLTDTGKARPGSVLPTRWQGLSGKL
jgi:hypothetical protein